MVPTKDDRETTAPQLGRVFLFHLLADLKRIIHHHLLIASTNETLTIYSAVSSCFSPDQLLRQSEKDARAIPLFANGIYFPPFNCALWHFETHQVFHAKAEGNIQSIIGFKSNHSHDHSWLVPARPVTASQITNQRQSFVIRCIRITNASKIFTKSCKEILWTWWSSRCGDEKHLYFKKIFLKITSRVVIKWSSCSYALEESELQKVNLFFFFSKW